MVPVRCVPDRIPVKIETDVTHLELGEHIATKDLKLPEGVTVRMPAEQTLVAVVAPDKEVEEVAPGTAAAAGAAAPAGGSVAPAAGAGAGGATAAAGDAAAAKGAPAKGAPAKDDKKKK
jgi:large subunit ribosomal protein L25